MNSADYSKLEEILEKMDILLDVINEFGDDPMVAEIREGAFEISSDLNELFEQEDEND